MPGPFFLKILAEMINEEKRANNEIKLLPKGELHQVLRNDRMTYFQVMKEALYAHDVQFRYEEVLWIDGHPFIPDFKILTPSGKIYYWDIAGW